MLSQLKSELDTLANPEKATQSARFFKTGPGQYGEGDKFLGLTVPEQRRIAKSYFKTLSLPDTIKLLSSPYHEYRLTAAFILVYKYEQATKASRHHQPDPTLARQIYDLYLANRRYINNWDLVDTTTPNIVGHFLLHHPEETALLTKFAKSTDLWERRIAMLATFPFIKAQKLSLPLQVAEILVNDSHDLIQKAVGWMLREIGKQDLPTEEAFLDRHYLTMPRTALRYSIEKFTPSKKDHYMGRK